MMKKLSVLISVALISYHALGCTTFVLKTANELVFGRNLDWYSDNGLMVINKRNVEKTALVFPSENPVKWTSKYGSVTFNQFGKEFPFGGMNERGLVVEIMVANAAYPLPDERPAINELQWIQYQLDNSATIDDVIASDKLLRIGSLQQELHFLICDSLGNTAAIEFVNHKMVVYKGAGLPYPVLENEPYLRSLNNYKTHKACRFTKAADMVQGFSAADAHSAIDYSFSILNRVAISAEWSIVYDIKNLKIHFNTSGNRQVKEVDLGLFRFNCDAESLVYDLNRSGKGAVNDSFVRYSPALNKEKVQVALQSSNIELPNEILSELYDYNEGCECKH